MQTKSRSSLVLIGLLVLAMLATLVGCQCGQETPQATTAPKATDAPVAQPTDKPAAGMTGEIALADSSAALLENEKVKQAYLGE